MKNQGSRIFYGWWVVLAAALGLCIGTAPLVVYSFGVYFKPLSQDFHAGRGAISLAFTAFNLTQAIAAPFVGRLVDRVGARRVILTATALVGLILAGAKILGSEIGMLYLFFIVLGSVAGATVFPYSVVVSRWFNRKRGLALGFMMLGIGIGAMAVPPIVQRLIGMFGWRSAYALSGCAVLLISLPVVSLLLLGDPREKRLLADGAAGDDAPNSSASSSRTTESGLSWHETWHRSEFWTLIGSFFFASASVHACVLHMPALMTDRGVSAEAAAIASSIVGMALLIGRFGTGYLLDRFFAPRIAMTFFAATAVGIGVLLTGATGRFALAAAFLVGLGMGAEADIIAYSLTRYFGLKSFGTAYGYSFAAFLVAGALGTFLMGAGFDWTHSYRVPLGGFLVSSLAAVWLMSRLGPYKFAVSEAGESGAGSAPTANTPEMAT